MINIPPEWIGTALRELGGNRSGEGDCSADHHRSSGFKQPFGRPPASPPAVVVRRDSSPGAADFSSSSSSSSSTSSLFPAAVSADSGSNGGAVGGDTEAITGHKGQSALYRRNRVAVTPPRGGRVQSRGRARDDARSSKAPHYLITTTVTRGGSSADAARKAVERPGSQSSRRPLGPPTQGCNRSSRAKTAGNSSSWSSSLQRRQERHKASSEDSDIDITVAERPPHRRLAHTMPPPERATNGATVDDPARDSSSPQRHVALSLLRSRHRHTAAADAATSSSLSSSAPAAAAAKATTTNPGASRWTDPRRKPCVGGERDALKAIDPALLHGHHPSLSASAVTDPYHQAAVAERARGTICGHLIERRLLRAGAVLAEWAYGRHQAVARFWLLESLFGACNKTERLTATPTAAAAASAAALTQQRQHSIALAGSSSAQTGAFAAAADNNDLWPRFRRTGGARARATQMAAGSGWHDSASVNITALAAASTSAVSSLTGGGSGISGSQQQERLTARAFEISLAVTLGRKARLKFAFAALAAMPSARRLASTLAGCAAIVRAVSCFPLPAGAVLCIE